MRPVLAELGPVTLYSYGIFIALGFLVGGFIVRHLAKKDGLETGHFVDYFLYAAVAGLLGARLWHVLFRPFEVDSFWQVFSLWGGGLALHGGLLLAAIVLLLVMRRQGQPAWRWLDVTAIGALAGLAIGKVGSFLNGDGFGRTSDLPWAVKFNDPLAPATIMGVELHPLQLYYALAFGLFAIGLYLIWRRQRQGTGRLPRYPGFVFLVGLFALSLTQFAFEALHAPIDSLYLAGSIKITSWVALLLAAIAAFLLVKRARQANT